MNNQPGAGVVDTISDGTLMGAVDVSLSDLNAAIASLRERGYDVELRVADDGNGLAADVSRREGQLSVSEHG